MTVTLICTSSYLDQNVSREMDVLDEKVVSLEFSSCVAWGLGLEFQACQAYQAYQERGVWRMDWVSAETSEVALGECAVIKTTLNVNSISLIQYQNQLHTL